MDDLGNRSDRRASAARTGGVRAGDLPDDRRTPPRREARQAVGEPADPGGQGPQLSAADDVPPPAALVPLQGADPAGAGASHGGGMEGLGARLKELRQQAGFSLRELARQADVSPSLVSQIENGKSRPSVSTLYTFARLLSVPVDELFDAEEPALAELPAAQAAGGAYDPANVWHPSEYATRISVIHPSHRAQLHMAEGVAWERLAATPERDVNFMKVTYAPGAGSGEGAERQLHDGYEYGYVLTGTLEVTVGNEVFVLHEGESLGFDSTIPHRFRNIGDSDFQGIWFVHGHSH
jgi:transcriptional regulator with XRE-family HTH domain